jgi:hypothetical protein
MSFDFSSLKWGRIALGVLVGFIIALVVNILLQVGYGVVLGFQARGMPDPNLIVAAVKSVPFQIIAALFVMLGGFVGGRMAARHHESNRPFAGLVTGVLLAIAAAVWRSFQWGAFDFWMVLQVLFAVAGGWLGGRAAARGTDGEYEESPQL